MRDIFNILFIFSLIYIGLRTILDSEDSGTRKALGKLIIAALLINFSLFITKTIVDFANIAAFQIHEVVDIQAEYGIGSFGSLTGKSIAGAYLDQMRLGTFAENGLVERIQGQAGGHVKVIVFGFLMMIMMIIAGVIFAAGALILVKRFILLIIFMIFSPMMFLGLIYCLLYTSPSPRD